MNPPEDLRRENQALRERLALLSQASLSINESLDFDTVLQGVLDSARSLTSARYGVIALHDDAGNAGDFLSSGMTRDEAERVWHQAVWSRPVATALGAPAHDVLLVTDTSEKLCAGASLCWSGFSFGRS